MRENLELLREQLVKLQSLRSTGVLDEAQFLAAREPLEKRIVQAVMAGAATPALANPHAMARVPRSLWLQAGAFVAVVAIAGYAWKGSPLGASGEPTGLDRAGAAAEGGDSGGGGAASGVSREQIEAMVAKLAARLKETPEDAEGWAMLGRAHMALGQQQEALQAFKTSLQARPNDAQTLADTADTLAASQGRNLDGEPLKLVERALAADPDNLKALALAGTMAFQKGEDATAVKHWDRAVRVGPADHPLVDMVRGAAAEARSRSKLPPAAGAGAAVAAAAVPSTAAAPAPAAANPSGAPNAPAVAAAAPSVSGMVRLAAALQAKASPEDTVFIFARNAEGGGMPLAILRKQVKDLPLAFTLDDSLAMSPAARISGAQQVVITARISKSGQAMPASGDLEGGSAPVAPGQREVQIEINKVRP